jgi:hypothetical protein
MITLYSVVTIGFHLTMIGSYISVKVNFHNVMSMLHILMMIAFRTAETTVFRSVMTLRFTI